jgi:hypothetical protein
MVRRDDISATLLIQSSGGRGKMFLTSPYIDQAVTLKTQRRCQTSEYEDSYALKIAADSSLRRFAKFIHR